MDLSGLRGGLQDLAADVSRGMRRARAREAAIGGAQDALARLPWIPFLAAGALLAGLDVPLGGLAVLTLVLLVLAIAAPAWAAAARPISQREALAVVDERLALQGRMQIAGEFLDQAKRTPFVVAALEDAATWLRGARGVELAHPRKDLPRAWLGRRLGLTALLFLLAGLLVPGPLRDLGGDLVDEVVALVGGGVETQDDSVVEADEPAPAPEPEAPGPGKSETSEPGAQLEDAPSKLSENEKESQGATGQGRSAQANSTSADASARGMPSDQAQPSKAAEKRPKNSKKPEAKKPRKETKRKAQEPKPSATTTGNGSSKGSGRNPTASEWSSPEQAPAPDESEIDEDEEVDDDEEEQESRGGVQPSLRDRRPPVSRDLRIGFGNRPNPDANGRGGPSEQKKSRGVASLVLGVPIPDRVKGRPGPGRTKVTQERVRPQGEDAAAQDARPVQPRDGMEGALSVLDLEPWLRSMVRDYFQRPRANAARTP